MQDVRFQAGALAVLGMGCLGFIDNFVRVIAQDFGLWQFHLLRSLIALAVALGLIWVFHLPSRPKSWRAVGIRSLFLAIATVFYFGSLAGLPIAQVAAGLFTAPIFVVLILAALGDRLGVVRLMAVCIGFVGVLLVLRPGVSGFEITTVLPVLAGFFWASGAVTTRKLCEDESAMTLLLGFFAALGICGAIGLLVLSGSATNPVQNGFFGTGWQPITQSALFWTFGQAIFSMAGIFMLIRAYLIAEASLVAVFENSYLVWAGIWGYLLWGDYPDLLGVLGIILIICAGVIAVLRESETTAEVRS